MRPGPKLNRKEREHHLQEVSRLYLKGREQAAIGLELDCTQQQISYDLKVLQRRWLAAQIMNVDAARARELAKVDHLERTYWDAWQQSLGERETTQTKKVEGGNPRVEAAIRKESREGNASFLSGVQWCIDRRCKLLGLDAPATLQHSGPEGGPIVVREIVVELPGADDRPGG